MLLHQPSVARQNTEWEVNAVPPVHQVRDNYLNSIELTSGLHQVIILLNAAHRMSY